MGPKGRFSFLHPKVKGGVGFGVYIYKNENHGLKMHFKSFQAILDNVVFFYPYTSPLILPEGGGSVVT